MDSISNNKPIRALGLCSGGLDSILAALVLRRQEVVVEWITFELPSDLSLEQKNDIAAELANKIGKLADRIHAFKNQVLLDRLILEIELCGSNP
jgi:tRNA U34 2-thiouridine synthase MnmA/TrmU